MTDFTKTIRNLRGWTSMIDEIIAIDGGFRYFYVMDRDDKKVGRVFLSSANVGFIQFGWNDVEKQMGTKEMFKEIKGRCGSSFSILPILNESFGLYRVTC